MILYINMLITNFNNKKIISKTGNKSLSKQHNKYIDKYLDKSSKRIMLLEKLWPLI